MSDGKGGGAAGNAVPEGWLGDGYRVRIHWDDTDCTKRVYLGKYIKWIDDAATEYLRARGMVFDPDGWLRLDGKELGESFVVGEYSCRIGHTSDFDDLLTVKIKVKEKRPMVIVFEGEISDQKGRVVARGTLTYIYIRKIDGGMKAAKMPPEVSSRF